MKIEKVIIQNLNSIEEAEIDFSEGVLAKEPLFLICGDTGSGKSTILDAISLALYDKASRYENVMNKEQTENGASDTKDTSNILRKGKSDGKAEVHFSIKNTYYIATWCVHKTKTNKYSSTNRRKLEVVDSGLRTVISNNITEVNKKIEELIGLTYDQFIRSVMLAQGEFNTFLVSKKSQQSEILEMLTGTEVYSEISDMIGMRKSAANQARKEAELIYNNQKVNVLSDEECNELENKKLLSESNIPQKEKNLQKLISHISWYKKNNDLMSECDRIKLLYDNALIQINSSEYLERKKTIDDYFKTTEIRENLKDLSRLETDVLAVNQQFDEDEKLFSAVDFSLNTVKENKNKLSTKILEIGEWIDKQKDKELVYNNTDFIISLFAELSKTSDSIHIKNNELRNNELAKNDVLLKLKTISDSLESVKTEKNNIENKLNDLLLKFDLKEYEASLVQQQELNDKKRVSLERINKLSLIRTVLIQYLELNKNIENEIVEHDNLKLSLNEKSEGLKILKSKFEAKDLEFQKQKNMVEEWAVELRKKIREGEPCPVCGSRQHYFKNEEIVNTLFASVESEWNKLKMEYEVAKDYINKTEAQLSTTSKNLILNKQKLETLFADLNKRCDGNPVFEVEKIDANIKKHEQLIVTYDFEIQKINDKLIALSSVKKEIDKAQVVKKQIEDKCNVLEKQFADKQIEYQQIELSYTAIQTTISELGIKFEEKKKSIDDNLKQDNWFESWNDNPENFIREIKLAALQWTEMNNQYKDIENQIANLGNILLQSDKYISMILDLYPFNNNNSIISQNVDYDSIVPMLSAILEKIKDRIEKKKSLLEKIHQLKNDINNFVSKSDNIDLERLKFLNDITDIQSIIDINNKLKDEVLKIKSSLSMKEEEYTKHQNSEDKPDDTIDCNDLEHKSLLLREEIKSDENILSEIKFKLESNKQNISKLDKYKKDLEEKDRIYHLWEQLAKAIGASNNNNFRDVAQAYTMGILLDRANYYLKQLSSRYILANYPDSLAIMVRDLEMGGEMRTASSLSGGETFLVSLSLALGLTSLNDIHFNIDMLFIDEGFGTLDSESLDMVMSTLENLHNLGKKVGIISHVDALKERIPAQIQLVRNGKSSSKVVVTRN